MSRNVEVATRIAAAIAEFRPIDVHVHQGTWSSFGAASPPDQRTSLGAESEVQDEARVRDDVMASFGVAEYWLLPSVHHDHSVPAVAEANRVAVAEAAAANAAIACAAVVGLRNDPKSLLEDIDRNDHRGLVFHHRFMGVVLDDHRMWPVCEWAKQAGWPIFVHVLAESSIEAVWRLERLARAFPAVTFVALDGLSSPSAAMQCMEIARSLDNVLFDTALMCPVPAIVEQWHRRAGDETLLYGSDLYVNPQSYKFPGPLYEIVASNIPRESVSRILRSNALRLLGRDGIESESRVPRHGTPAALSEPSDSHTASPSPRS